MSGFLKFIFPLIILCGCGDQNPPSGGSPSSNSPSQTAETSSPAPGLRLDEKAAKAILRRGLIEAAKTGDLEAVRAYIKYGADTEQRDEFYGKTPLYWAAQQDHLEVVKALLSAGADPNARASLGGGVPLKVAAYNGHTDVVKALLKGGANPNLKDTGFFRGTALHDAAKHGHRETVEALLKGGANPNITNLNGKKPVDVATDPSIKALFSNP